MIGVCCMQRLEQNRRIVRCEPAFDDKHAIVIFADLKEPALHVLLGFSRGEFAVLRHQRLELMHAHHQRVLEIGRIRFVAFAIRVRIR